MTAGPMTSILDAIGGTALVELTRVAPGFDGRVFAKLEHRNPGGSVEDRSARAAVERLLRRGDLEPGGTLVIETAASDFAVSAAQVCRARHIELACVVDRAVADRGGALLRAYGARVEVPPDAADSEWARVGYARDLAARLGAHWPGPHAELRQSQSDPGALLEIVEEMAGRPDYVICDAGAASVLRGAAEHIAAGALPIRLIAVDVACDPSDAVSPTDPASTDPASTDPGSRDPSPMPEDPADDGVHAWFRVTEAQAAAACRRLVDREAILAGPRSGAALAAFERLADRISAGATVVLLFPDNGFRHLDTVHSGDSPEQDID